MNGEGAVTRGIWAAGNYEVIAARIREASERLVALSAIEPGERVLDVGCGTGNAAIAAALAGGSVSAIDIAPEMFEAGRERAAAERVVVDWIEADAERLPFDDESFDVVLSAFGCMFARHHDDVATEMVRVLRPGGRLVIASWTPTGAVGEFFRVINEHAPTPAPEFAFQPPTLWGLAPHADGLFAPHGVRLEHHFEILSYDFASVEQAKEEYMNHYGPIVVLHRVLEPLGLWQAFYDDLEETLARINVSEDGGLAFDADYLVSNGVKPG